MCGICGIYQYEDQEPVDRTLIQRMCDVMKHRGPDDEGIYLDGHVGFGHRRLSILDLSGGHQPMTNEDQSVWIVFNGEIYNYKDLQKTLHSKGHVFKTKCDTEVIIHAYETYGFDCVNHFQGMFAFTIWDQKKQILFMARDRVGIKPLYYTLHGGRLCFASEIKAIVQDNRIPRDVNELALDHYMSFGYTPSEYTMFRGIQKLPPGHRLIIKNKSAQIEPFWDLTFPQAERKSDTYYFETLQSLLDDSVAKRLQSDVPLGVFLSGGMDSSTIVAEMVDLGINPIQSFSVGFDQKGYSELPYARMVADHFKTEHHEIIVTAKDYLNFFPKYVWHQDEPMSDPATIALHYLSKLAKEHVTVVLTGEGADEALAGYERYWSEKIARYLYYMPKWVRTGIIHAMLKPFRNNPKIKKTMRMLPLDHFHDRYLTLRSAYLPNVKQNLYQSEFNHKVLQNPHFKEITRLLEKNSDWDVVQKMMYTDTKLWLPEDLLMKKDKMGMSTSIEARVPFLDHRLLEFAATIPMNLKIRGFQGKYILREMMKPKLPKIITQRKKCGFEVPLGLWYQNELSDLMGDTLTSSRFRNRGYFNRAFVDNLIDSHLSNKEGNGFVIHQLLCLETWFRLYIDETVATGNNAKSILL